MTGGYDDDAMPGGRSRGDRPCAQVKHRHDLANHAGRGFAATADLLRFFAHCNSSPRFLYLALVQVMSWPLGAVSLIFD